MERDENDPVDRIRAELVAKHDEWYALFERARDDSRIRYEDLVARHEQLIEEFEQLRKDQGYRFDNIDTDMEHSRRTNRETLLEIREMMHISRDIRHGIQSSVEGLLRVLDELRKDDGPSPAGA
jgi:hypothetical protein